MIINLTYGTMLDLIGKRKKKKGHAPPLQNIGLSIPPNF